MSDEIATLREVIGEAALGDGPRRHQPIPWVAGAGAADSADGETSAGRIGAVSAMLGRILARGSLAAPSSRTAATAGSAAPTVAPGRYLLLGYFFHEGEDGRAAEGARGAELVVDEAGGWSLVVKHMSEELAVRSGGPGELDPLVAALVGAVPTSTLALAAD